MLAKCLNKVFALDCRSTGIEHGIIIGLVAAGLIASVLALSHPLPELFTPFADVAANTVVNAGPSTSAATR